MEIYNAVEEMDDDEEVGFYKSTHRVVLFIWSFYD